MQRGKGETHVFLHMLRDCVTERQAACAQRGRVQPMFEPPLNVKPSSPPQWFKKIGSGMKSEEAGQTRAKSASQAARRTGAVW